jgi:dTDP-4-amino-4,6-dideoxygalactose transaminase
MCGIDLATFTVLVDEDVYGMDSRAVMGRLAAYDIQSRPLWQPMYLSPAHGNLERGPYAVSESLYLRGLSLPSSVGLQSMDQERVIRTLVELAN